MSGGDLLGISSSGVIAAQRALTTTGHNIANASTPGYSRQGVEMEARKPQFAGNGTIGTGVIVDNVSRNYDEFVVKELRNTTSLSKHLDKSYEFTSQVDDILADPQAGLSPALSGFFEAVNGLANDPSSTASRQVLLSSARNLSDRFHYLSVRFDSLRESVNQDMTTSVSQINEIADAIAELNVAIVRSRELTDRPANDLLDQRDLLVQQLSERINVRTTVQDDGRMNVFVGNGQTLVVGDIASEIDIRPNEHDPTTREIVFQGAGGDTVITQFISGGELGGLINFHEEVLAPAQNELGRIAMGLAQTFNKQHKLGIDLESQLGKNFFSQVDKLSPIVLPSINNKGDMLISAEITDTNKLTTSNYQLAYMQGQFELLRLEDKEVVARFGSLPQEIEADGLRLTLKAGSTIQENDRFLIQPTRRAAEMFDVELDSVADIAAATPIRATADIDNLGDAKIEVVQVTDTTNELFQAQPGQLSPPYIVRFVNENQFEILDNSGNPVKVRINAVADDPNIDLNAKQATSTPIPETPADGKPVEKDKPPEQLRNDKLTGAGGLGNIEGPIAYDPDEGIDLFPTPGGLDRGIKLRIDGEPKAGDIFRIEYNEDSTSDNKNALSLADLQTKMSLMNGTSDYAQTYGQLVSRVGSKTHELDINRKAQKLLLDQAIETREEISGVNLDEEAAELVRFQNLYQANAQVVAAANQTFQVLMDTFRR